MVLGLTAVPHSVTQLLDEGTSQERGNCMAVWHMPEQGLGLGILMPIQLLYYVSTLPTLYSCRQTDII